MKKWMSCLLAVCLTLPLVSVAAPYVMAGFEPDSVGRDWAGNAFFRRMEEKTGLAFAMRQFGKEEAWQKEVASWQAGGDMPDVLFKANLSYDQALSLYERGVLLDLAPLLPRHAPHLWEALNADARLLDAVRDGAGRILTLPFIPGVPTMNALWVDQTWLDAVRMDMPSDRESLIRVLRAFQRQDPNGNGRRDEIPLSFQGIYDLKYLGHLFDIFTDDLNLYMEEGQVKHLTQHPRFEEFALFLRALYQEGLLDPDGFAMQDGLRAIRDAKSKTRFGFVFAPFISRLTPAEWLPNYRVVMPMNAQKAYRAAVPPVVNGTFAITTKADDPQALLAWVDILYTEAGAALAHEGAENEDYVVDGDGARRKTPQGEAPDFLASRVIASGTAFPGLSADRFLSLYHDGQAKNSYAMLERLSRTLVYPTPPLHLEAEDSQRVAVWQRELGRVTDEALVAVITEKNLAPDCFENLHRTLEAKGLGDFLQFFSGLFFHQR